MDGERSGQRGVGSPPPRRAVRYRGSTNERPMELPGFLERVLAHLPAAPPTSFFFTHWAHGGRPTDEGVGILPVPGLDPDKAIDAVMDVDHYRGNLEHCAVCRSIKDPRFVPPQKVRFYQKIDVPLLGATEVAVPGGLPRCVRVLLHFYTSKPARALKHTYLQGAAKLRPDRQPQ